MKFYLLETHRIYMQQVAKTGDEQGQQGSKEHLQPPYSFSLLPVLIDLLNKDYQKLRY